MKTLQEQLKEQQAIRSSLYKMKHQVEENIKKLKYQISIDGMPDLFDEVDQTKG